MRWANPYLGAILQGKQQGYNEAVDKVIELLTNRIHNGSCDCYECIEIKICVGMILVEMKGKHER